MFHTNQHKRENQNTGHNHAREQDNEGPLHGPQGVVKRRHQEGHVPSKDLYDEEEHRDGRRGDVRRDQVHHDGDADCDPHLSCYVVHGVDHERPRHRQIQDESGEWGADQLQKNTCHNEYVLPKCGERGEGERGEGREGRGERGGERGEGREGMGEREGGREERGGKRGEGREGREERGGKGREGMGEREGEGRERGGERGGGDRGGGRGEIGGGEKGGVRGEWREGSGEREVERGEGERGEGERGNSGREGNREERGFEKRGEGRGKFGLYSYRCFHNDQKTSRKEDGVMSFKNVYVIILCEYKYVN